MIQGVVDGQVSFLFLTQRSPEASTSAGDVQWVACVKVRLVIVRAYVIRREFKDPAKGQAETRNTPGSTRHNLQYLRWTI